jgi:hypothetical protein
VLRGNDRMPCFLDDLDRRLYLQAMREMSMRYACRLHAYVLMTTAELQLAYRALFDEVLSNEDISDIRAYFQQQRALGIDRFRAMVEQKFGRCASLRPPRRPRATSKPADKAL